MGGNKSSKQAQFKIDLAQVEAEARKTKTQNVHKGEQEILALPSCKQKSVEKMRIVCLSDTHSRQDQITFKLPKGDVLVHSGDFSFGGEREEIVKFVAWFSKLPYK